VLYTDEMDSEDEVDAIPGEELEVNLNNLLVLDRGRKLEQLKAEHPTTTFEMFKRELLREIARCLNMPYNVAAGDSSKYNYASGRLDHQTYDRSIKIEQDYFGGACLDRTFLRWLEEAMLIPGYLPPGLPPFVDWNWLWFFDGRPHVDPLKEAAASTTLINGLLQTEKAYFAERGLDWEEQERQMATELGVTVAEFRKLKAVKRFVTGSAQEEMVRQLLELEAREEAQAESEEFANAD
jgi:capsid protein